MRERDLCDITKLSEVILQCRCQRTIETHVSNNSARMRESKPSDARCVLSILSGAADLVLVLRPRLDWG